MITIFNECTRLKIELDSLRPLSIDDEQRIMQKFRLDWNYHSNHLEGNSLTYGETKALILFGITAQGKPLKDHFEVTGHNEAINWVLEVIKEDRPLTENFIRELHKLILKEPYEVDTITPDGKPSKKMIKVGQYKTSPNHVKTKTGEIFRFATPEDTPIKMNELVQWYNKKAVEADVNPVLLAAEFHYRYIRIHPFDDGNGRTARILMNFILLQFGFPPVVIKTEDKANYFAALQQADAGIFTAFAEYIAQNLKNSLELMIAGAKGESIEEKDDLEKEIALLEQSVKAVGKTIEIIKSETAIKSVYDNGIENLLRRFESKSKLLSNFYLSTSFTAFSTDSTAPNTALPIEKIVSNVRASITNWTKQILAVCSYTTFNQFEFEKFSWTSKLSIVFEQTHYNVYALTGDAIVKLYNETLSDKEIETLVNGEIRRHKEAIEKRIEEIKNKKLS